MVATLFGFSVALGFELVLLAVLRIILKPEPEGSQMYLLGVLLGSMLLAGVAAYFAQARLHLPASKDSVVMAPVFILITFAIMWWIVLALTCHGVQTPFFVFGCN